MRKFLLKSQKEFLKLKFSMLQETINKARQEFEEALLLVAGEQGIESSEYPLWRLNESFDFFEKIEFETKKMEMGEEASKGDE